MENIFENAKFGDKFVTENGELAIFFKHRGENSNFLLLEHSGGICYEYNDNGRCYEDPEWHCNIVSKYQEPIDKELEKISPSRHQAQDYLEAEGYLDENGNFIDYVERAVQIGFEWGYKKAKEE